MGCHTWCYKRASISDEEIIAIARKKVDEQLSKTEEEIKADNEKYSAKCSYDEWQQMAREHEKLIIEKDWEAVMDNLLIDYEYRNGVFYEDAEFHDIFRVGNYPDDELFSLEQTTDYLAKTQHYDLDKPYLEEFWNKYPDGMIRFG